MRITLLYDHVTVEPTRNDERYPETWAGESRFFYHVKKLLNAHGFSLIKKEPGKDGNLTAAPYYLRCTSRLLDAPHIFLYDPYYQIRIITEEFNIGAPHLRIEYDIYEKQPDCVQRVMRLLAEPIVGEYL